MTTSSKVSVIKFSAVWCRPCTACAPAFHDLQRTFNNVTFKEIDIERDANDAAGTYSIKSLPTFVILIDDVEVDRVVGADVPSVSAKLTKIVDTLTSSADLVIDLTEAEEDPLRSGEQC